MFQRELRPMIALAGPVVMAEIGWMSMGIVDTIMVGRIGAEAIGAVGIGSSLFLALAVFGIGLLLGLDTLVAQAWGANRREECHGWLHHGVVLALLLTLPLTLLALAAGWSLRLWGLHPDVRELTGPYFAIVTWSVLPLLLYAAFRRYLQALGIVRPVMAALIGANVINIAANWALVFGNLGAPALGVNGAAWATCLSRVFLAASLLAAILHYNRRLRLGLLETRVRLEIARFRRLLALGTPAALQITLEVGVFAAATALAGALPPVSLAAHQIALNMAGVTFMVPLGVGAAGAVRVGHAVGRRDPEGAGHAGWMAFLLGTAFMAAAAAVFVLLPRPLLRVFTADVDVIAVGVSLLLVAALFQMFDGVQGVATGVLRGLGDTKTPMMWNLAGHWLLGLPLGYTLCFTLGWGVVGLWIGLSTGLILVAIALLRAWAGHLRNLEAGPLQIGSVGH